MSMFKQYLLGFCLLAMAVGVLLMPPAQAVSAKKINIRVQEALQTFKEEVPGGQDVLKKAKGVLVFPKVYQGGIGLGGEYGEGALLIGGKTQQYYRLVSASVGWQLGGQSKAILVVFMNPDVLAKFKNSQGWEFGVDASATVVTLGKEGSINSTTLNAPVLAFVVDQKGLMYDLSLEGTKISKIDR